MSDEEVLTATEASRAFSDVLHRVCYGGESFVIKKGHRLMARIVPVIEETPVPAPKQSAAKPAPAKAETTAKIPAPAQTKPAPAKPSVSTRETAYSDPDYYKTVAAEMNKLLSE